MAARKHAQKLRAAVSEVLLRQIADVQRTLKSDTLSDEAVHDIRKGLKRARAALRLLRDAMGKSRYARVNAALRDAARPLGRVRDAAVMLETLKELRQDEHDVALRAELQKIGERSVQAQARARHEVLEKPGVLKKSAQRLAAAHKRLAALHFAGDARSAPRTGLARIYRRGRKALAKADAGRSDATLHELRKQAKYLFEALGMCSPKQPELRKLQKHAEIVGKKLGDDHDLAALQSRIARGGRRSAALKTLLGRIDKRRGKLQAKALEEAGRLYKRKQLVKGQG